MTEQELQQIRGGAAEAVARYCFNHSCTECPFVLISPWDDRVRECVFYEAPTLWQTDAIGSNPDFTPEEAAQ